MISYKDMTFCTHYGRCANGGTCFRALTSKVLKEADVWWNKDRPKGEFAHAPICVYMGPPDCFEPIGSRDVISPLPEEREDELV